MVEARGGSAEPPSSFLARLPVLCTYRRAKNGPRSRCQVDVASLGNPEDAARKLNRTENLRPIPPGDTDFVALFGRRNDAAAVNRRAHSLGHRRQLLNLLGYALVVNSLALSRHRRRSPSPLAA